MKKIRNLFKKKTPKLNTKKIRKVRNLLKNKNNPNYAEIIQQELVDSEEYEAKRLDLIEEERKKLKKIVEFKKKSNDL